MIEIKELFKAIERDDVDENMQGLISEDIIDSIDIMALVAEIEKRFGKALDAKFITAENFESFEAISKMLEKAFS